MNIADYLPSRASRSPNLPAIHFQKENKSYTYRELEDLSNQYANGLISMGAQKGDRIVLMVRPGVDFIAITFALFKVGAVAVLIDPGIGIQFLATCIREVEPKGFIGIPKSHLLRLISPSSFKTLKYTLAVGTQWLFGIPTVASFKNLTNEFKICNTASSDPAAIIFTTGSTGIPKGVVYEHGMFDAQLNLLKNHYQIEEGEVDMPTFPLFALFSVGMGTTCVIPDMDPTKPGFVNPQKIIDAIRKYKVTYSFGSPALWNRVTSYCMAQKIKLSTVRRILIAGAPVSPMILERFNDILSPSAKVFTPYGATEALPMTSIEKNEILKETLHLSIQGKGICVGYPLPGINLKIIRITDDPIQRWDPALCVDPGIIGEICTKGPMVTTHYFNRPHQTKLAKILDSDGTVFHRMGDVGYLDDKGRVWFCGRKNHRVTLSHQTLFTIPCEAIFNQHPEVSRSALVGVYHTPNIIIEPKDPKILKDFGRQNKLRQELLSLARNFPHTQDIQTILFHPSFPVDIRHNAKIGREKLALWAQKRCQSP